MDDAKLGENPTADDRADQAEDDVADAAESFAAREFAGEPSRDEAEENPAEKTVGPAYFDIDLAGGSLQEQSGDGRQHVDLLV